MRKWVMPVLAAEGFLTSWRLGLYNMSRIYRGMGCDKMLEQMRTELVPYRAKLTEMGNSL